jgi:predicted Ser/Thr protein kinase
VGGDARDIGADHTLPAAPPALGETQQASQPGVLARGTADVAGTDDTAHAPSANLSRAPGAFVRLAPWLRSLHIAIAAVAACNVVYFIARFLVSASPPTLHKAYIGEVHGGPFQAMDIFDGPFLTLARVTLVAAIFVVMSLWVVRRNRNDTVVLLVSIGAIIAGQSSLAVAVLTSSETLLAPRIVAASIYMAMPIVGLGILALFPSGRPVPRWSVYLIPPALIPFGIQTAIMFGSRGFSVPVATTFFPLAFLFLGFQWHRYRKIATVRERTQIKWLSYAGVVFISLQLVVIRMIPLLEHRDSPAFPFVRVLFELVLGSSYLLALACLLFSAARYRLWDVDRVINRTIVYALVTGTLGAACTLGYFALRAVLASVLHGPIVSATVAVAVMVAAFAPLRRRVARWIDRRFYGIGLDYEALAAKAVRAAHATLPTSATELGAYDELVLLGHGGMGAVYRAHHADFAGPVALKVMSPALAGDADAQARFRRESQILEDLQHPNVIPFLATGHENGLAFIAMQYIEGEDLGRILRRRRTLGLDEIAPLIDGVAAALDLAHRRGVVHRDIKPSNIFIEGTPAQPLAQRRALVMDFGVARLAGDPSAADASLVGSLPYIAPEQIHNGDQVDARADIYALGATVYELVTGRPPFVESTALGLVLAHLHQPPQDPRTFVPTLAPKAATAIIQALAKQPADRFETASDFAAQLH